MMPSIYTIVLGLVLGWSLVTLNYSYAPPSLSSPTNFAAPDFTTTIIIAALAYVVYIQGRRVKLLEGEREQLAKKLADLLKSPTAPPIPPPSTKPPTTSQTILPRRSRPDRTKYGTDQFLTSILPASSAQTTNGYRISEEGIAFWQMRIHRLAEEINARHPASQSQVAKETTSSNAPLEDSTLTAAPISVGAAQELSTEVETTGPLMHDVMVAASCVSDQPSPLSEPRPVSLSSDFGGLDLEQAVVAAESTTEPAVHVSRDGSLTGDEAEEEEGEGEEEEEDEEDEDEDEDAEGGEEQSLPPPGRRIIVPRSRVAMMQKIPALPAAPAVPLPMPVQEDPIQRCVAAEDLVMPSPPPARPRTIKAPRSLKERMERAIFLQAVATPLPPSPFIFPAADPQQSRPSEPQGGQKPFTFDFTEPINWFGKS
ncbi:hypothetical protein ABW19_dt0201526 [Dactylella cylindrospora]|nr:hypothetical protein ABW19_dt0201526 [Dactylella cylindrospora]